MTTSAGESSEGIGRGRGFGSRPWLMGVLLVLGGCYSGPPRSSGPVTPSPVPVATPTPTPPVDPIVDLTSRAEHTCALRQSGTVLCWGRNDQGQLGNGSQRDSARLVKVDGLVDAVQVVTGRDFSCAIRKGGSVVCWGHDDEGQLGSGRQGRADAPSLRASRVNGLGEVVELSTGEYHTCALERGGTVACWGNGDDGQIGSDAQQIFTTPQRIGSLGSVAQVASGWSHVCARETSGKVWCWGRNTEGQLGDGKSGSRIKPVTVATIRDVVEVVSGHEHSCARTRDGRVWCWGDNASGQLGPLARGEAKAYAPVEVRDLGDVVQLAAGDEHSCARLRSGQVTCWGSNAAGQLAPGAARGATRAAARDIDDAIDVALGTRHTCVLRAGGEVACWGDGHGGALGPYRTI